MIWTLFAVGTFWFWALLALMSCILFGMVEHERGGAATLTVIATLLMLYFFGNFDVFGSIFRQPLHILFYLGLYFAFGVVWAVIKWWSFLWRMRERYDEAFEKFLANNQVTEAAFKQSEKLKEQWAGRGYCEVGDRTIRGIPQARDYKARIVTWMTYWPWSLLWTLFSDFVRRIFEHIYRQVQKIFQAVANHVFKGAQEHLPRKK